MLKKCLNFGTGWLYEPCLCLVTGTRHSWGRTPKEPRNGLKRVMSLQFPLYERRPTLVLSSLAFVPSTSAERMVSNTAMYSQLHEQTGFGDVLTGGIFNNCNQDRYRQITLFSLLFCCFTCFTHTSVLTLKT